MAKLSDTNKKPMKKKIDKNSTEKSPADENATDKNTQLPNSNKKTRILLFQFFCVKKFLCCDTIYEHLI